MAKYEDLAPEKNVPLPYDTEYASGMQKFFDAPDFVQLSTDKETGLQTIEWATEFTAMESLDALRTFIEQGRFRKGRIALEHTFRRPEIVMGSSIYFRGGADDIIYEVHDSPDRVSLWELGNHGVYLSWHPAWPFDFHDIPTNEISLYSKRAGELSRFMVVQCMTETARPGLRNVIDTTLDELAVYEPSLAR